MKDYLKNMKERKQKLYISKTLQKREITGEELLMLESLDLLKMRDIIKDAEGRYFQYFWYQDTGQ